jgi:hypothetical protein
MPSTQPSLSPLTTSNLQQHSLARLPAGPSAQVDREKAACIEEARQAGGGLLRNKSVNEILNFAQERPESLRGAISQSTFDKLRMYAEVHEEESSQTVSVEFEDLARVLTGITDPMARLRHINERLEAMRTEQELTMTDIVKAIRRHGICLGNGKAYGAKLKAVLKKNKGLIVPKDLAKEFKYVKKCLVRLN